jgi:pimeloyl-ACP methyl ester carboxylesterase
MRLLALLLTLSTPAMAGTISLKTADGVTVAADVQGTGASGVVLVHGDGRSRADWTDVAASLSHKGLQVLSVDLRTHDSPWTTLDDTGRAAMVADVRAGSDWLRAHGAKTVAIIGADSGGALALAAGAADPGATNVILLSPRLSLPGVSVTASLAGWGKRPLLLISSTGDTVGVRAAGAIGDKAAGPHEVSLVEGSGVGPSLIRVDPQIEGQIVGWIANGGVERAAGDTTAVKTGDTTSLETTGTRIGEKP